MKRAVLGMTIFECLVYLGICAVLSSVLFSWWVSSHHQLGSIHGAAAYAVQEQLLAGVIWRDCIQASSLQRDWKVQEGYAQFKTSTGIITYQLKKKTLERKQMELNGKKAHTGVVARNIASMHWDLLCTGNSVREVRVQCKGSNGQSYAQHIRLPGIS